MGSTTGSGVPTARTSPSRGLGLARLWAIRGGSAMLARGGARRGHVGRSSHPPRREAPHAVLLRGARRRSVRLTVRLKKCRSKARGPVCAETGCAPVRRRTSEGAAAGALDCLSASKAVRGVPGNAGFPAASNRP